MPTQSIRSSIWKSLEPTKKKQGKIVGGYGNEDPTLITIHEEWGQRIKEQILKAWEEKKENGQQDS